jgi:hypothetical protein
LHRIDLRCARLSIALDLAKPSTASDGQDILVTFEIDVAMHRKARAHPIVLKSDGAPRRDPDLVALVADARNWRNELVSGSAETVAEITDREGLRKGAVSRVLQLAWLVPDISAAILEGRQANDLTATRLRSVKSLPFSWVEPHKML